MKSFQKQPHAPVTKDKKKSGGWMLHSSQVKRVLYLGIVGLLATACAAPQPEVKQQKKRSKEYFAESAYGVKASPRVANGKKIPRGGGRNQVGKPYKVKDKWYKPKEDPNYVKVGRASWYGSAFHGRLTANGEVYDMAHLTAAHPTMPLPSYARVTNTANGSSVIVRVNDRGPYSNDRIIDMSEKAAEMLDYKHHGTANVKVEYVGRAPLHGLDDAYLMASYRPAGSNDNIGQPATGVMMAMNGPTPTSAPNRAEQGSASAFDQISGQPQLPFGFADGAAPALPAVIPVPLDKPYGLYAAAQSDVLVSAYASNRIAQANEGIYSKVLMPDAASADWRNVQVAKFLNSTAEQGEFVDLGTFSSKVEADRIAVALGKLGAVSRSMTPEGNGALYSLTAKSRNGNNDALLQAAWAAGANDAFVVRAE